jgi:tRNA(Ile)-lysidine synthase
MPMNILDDTFREQLNLIAPLGEPQTLVVGVSGGCDSMVLLHALKKQNVALVAAHVNYNTRGIASTADENLVRQTCDQLNIPLHVKSITSDNWPKGNFQDGARRIRFEFFDELARAFNCHGIALGHHHNDQVETVLLKWLRASGIAALQGMQNWDPDTRVFRPLLRFTRVQIEAYAHSNAIEYREDASNATNNYARNWLRNTFGSELNSLIPGWDSNVIKQAARATAQSELNNFIVNKFFLPDDSLTLSMNQLDSLSQDAQQIVLASWLKAQSLNPTEGQLGQLCALTLSQPGSKVHLDQVTTVWRERNSLKLVRSRNANYDEQRTDFSKLPVTINHENIEQHQTFFLKLPEISISIDTVDGQFTQGITTSATTRSPDEKGPDTEIIRKQARNGQFHLDAGKISFPLTIRHWEAGDRFKSIGLSGTRKVSDFLNDRKIQPHQKNKAMVMVGFDGNILAVIFPHKSEQGLFAGISGDCKLTASTKIITRITISATS